MRVFGRALNLRPEFRRKFAEHRRAMHADLFEQPPMHHRHHAAAAGCAAMVGALPGRADEARRFAWIERGRRFVFQFFEGQADVVAQCFEPASGAGLAIFDHGDIHLCLTLWPEVSAAFIATVPVNADTRDLSRVLNSLPELQPENRQNSEARPAWAPSPCNVRKISFTA